MAATNGGSVMLNGANTYSGATALTSGTIAVGASSMGSPGAVTSGPLGTGTLAMAAGTTLSFTGSQTIANAITVSGDPTFLTTAPSSSPVVMSGTITDATPPAPIGSVVVDGGGYIELSGPNTYSGGTTICGATATTACTSTNGTTPTTLIVTNSTPGTSSSIGTGTLTFDGGVLQSNAPVTLSNAIAINSTGGTLGGNDHTLFLAGNITNGNATTGALTIQGDFSELGGVSFGGTNTYSGPTTITSSGNLSTYSAGALSPNSAFTVDGFLELNNSNTIYSLSGNGTINDGGVAETLTIAPTSGTTTFSGVILGNGYSFSIVKSGAGTQVFAAAGSYAYIGATTINGGTLEVDGSIASSSLTSVNIGGTLDGTGRVGIASIGGGTFAPGNGTAGSSQTVQGNLGMSSGTYQVFINPTTSSFATVTGGTATLAGGTVNATFATGSYVTHDYEILAGTHSGAFAGLTTSNAPSGFAESLDYSNSAGVYLDLTATLGALGTGGLNGNQQAVANALNNYFNNGGTLPANFVTVFGLTGPQLAQALSQLDGEDGTGAATSTFQLVNDFFDLLSDIALGTGGGGAGANGGGASGFAAEDTSALPPDLALAYNRVLKKQSQSNAAAPQQNFEQRWTAWGSGFGGGATYDGNAVIGSNNLNASDYGYAGGMDYHAAADLKLGFALAGGGTNWSLAQNLGSGRSDVFQAAAYGIKHYGPLYFTAMAAFGNSWFTTTRTAALGDQLRSSFDGQDYALRGETGYRYAVMPTVGLTPYAAIQTQWLHTPGYSESDLTGGGFALSYAAQNASDTRSELGARADDLTMFGATPLLLRARLAWAHDWVSGAALTPTFQALPGASFIVNGAAVPRNSALVSAGGQLFLTANWSFEAKFDGEFASSAQTYAGTGTLRYAW